MCGSQVDDDLARMMSVVINDRHAARGSLRLEPPPYARERLECGGSRSRVVSEGHERCQRGGRIACVMSPRDTQDERHGHVVRPSHAPALVSLLEPPVCLDRLTKREGLWRGH